MTLPEIVDVVVEACTDLLHDLEAVEVRRRLRKSDPDLRRARLLAAGAGAVWTAAWSSVSRIDPDLMTP